MSNNDNSPGQPPQQPGMAPFPYGFMPNIQMMQQLYHPMQANQMAGMQFNGPAAVPHMMPNLPMYLNPYHPMGGMPFNPMLFPPGRMPMMPPMGGQVPMMPTYMGGPMPAVNGQTPPVGAQVPPMPATNGQAPPGQVPNWHASNRQMQSYVQYVMVPVRVGPVPATSHTQVKTEDDEESVVDYSDPQQSGSFSMASILNQDEVKREPIDKGGIPAPNKANNSSTAAGDSSIKRTDKPAPPVRPPTQTHDDIPDAPASPDCNSDDPDTHDDGHRIIPSQPVPVARAGPSVVPAKSRDVTNSSVPSHPNSRKWINSFKEKSHSPPYPDFPMTDDSIETNVDAGPVSAEKTIDETMKAIERQSEEQTERGEGRKCGGKEKTPLPAHPPIVAPRVPIQPPSPSRPPVPPRFPAALARFRRESERSTMSRDDSGSPWRTTKSPVKSGRVEKRRKRHSVLLKGVHRKMSDEKLARYFGERFGRCRVTRLSGQAGTVRIEFVSKRDRDHAFEYSKVTIDKERVTIHEDDEAEGEIKEETGASRESAAPSAIRIPPSVIEKRAARTVASVDLKRYQRLCEKGHREIILTAGPIPKTCGVSSLVEYFSKLNSYVMDVPYPRYQSHKEYLVLHFPDIDQAKKVLVAAEHRVAGHIIPVSPPYDVHLQLHGVDDTDREDVVAHLVHTLQNACGILVTLPWLRFQTSTFSYGYVTFARPQDAHAAIQTLSFNMNGKDLRVVESNVNQSFLPFKAEWALKCEEEEKRAEREKEENEKRAEREKEKRAEREKMVVSVVMEGASKSMSTESSTSEEKRNKKTKKRSSLQLIIPDYPAPTLTVGPIPSKRLAECDEYLLSNFDEVYTIPYEIEDKHFRVIRVPNSDVVAEELKEGYLRVGRKKEKVLISPSFDVLFKSQFKAPFDIGHLVTNMQRKYGPIIYRPVCHKKTAAKLTFGRIQDALRAIKDSPHLKSLQVHAREAEPNLSFIPFDRHIKIEQVMAQVKDAERMEQAANIHVEIRSTADEKEGQNLGKRHRQEEKNDDVMACSPPTKVKNEEQSVIVRVTDAEQWIPDKSTLLRHFGQFGTIADFAYKEHLEAVITFEDYQQARKALQQPRIKVGGRWLDVLPSNM